MRTTRLAIDIETVSPHLEYWEKPNFRDSHDFELLTVALALESTSEQTADVDVIFRNGWGPESELGLIDDVAKRIEEAEAAIHLSYNGEAFDFPHLRGRARIASSETCREEEITDRIDSALSLARSDDLIHDAWETFGDFTTLEDACAKAGVSLKSASWHDYAHRLNVDHFRTDRNKGNKTLLGSDIAQLGEYYLDWCDGEGGDKKRLHALEEMLRTYATSDVVPLFELANARPYQ